MHAEALRRVRNVAVCLIASCVVAGPWVPAARAQTRYTIDIEGTIEITGLSRSGKRIDLEEENVAYKVIFRYYEPSPGADPGAPSFRDRAAQVSQGHFEILDLASDKVYRVSVLREIIPDSGQVITEEIPLDIDPDLFQQTPLTPDAPPVPLRVELPIVPAGQVEAAAKRALAFLYNGSDVMLSALTEEPVS